MAYTDVPSAVGTLRPAAAPRLALAAPQPDRRRAFELLAASHDGATEALVRGHGFTVKQMVELARDDGARGRLAVVRSRSLACGLLRVGRQALPNDEALQIDA